MIKLSTKTKLKIATALYKSAHYSRAMFGGKDLVHCKRGGVNWELDLTEGIDLAIYLFGRFERSTSLALQRAIRPGMTVLDIGANVGAHALPMALWAGVVSILLFLSRLFPFSARLRMGHQKFRRPFIRAGI
jgi:23S rRNA G2069 N7-methylase RlmK/C1962 C5-methylase RlmI